MGQFIDKLLIFCLVKTRAGYLFNFERIDPEKFDSDFMFSFGTKLQPMAIKLSSHQARSY